MRRTLEVGGRTRTYAVVGDEESDRSRALIVVFHGSKQSGQAHRRFTGNAFDELTRGGDVVVAYLDGYRGNWNDARSESFFPARLEGVDDVGFARAVVEELVVSHHVDPARVVAVGYSNGGQMVMRLIHEAPELLAGAAVLSATLPAGDSLSLPADLPPAKPMPVLVVHGTKDPIVSYQGGTMRGWARRLFKVGGTTLSSPATAEYFAHRNGLSAAPVTTRPYPPTGRSTWIEQTEYAEPGRPPVRLVTVHGAGHTIPGPRRAPFILGRTNQDISTATMVAEFFALRP